MISLSRCGRHLTTSLTKSLAQSHFGLTYIFILLTVFGYTGESKAKCLQPESVQEILKEFKFTRFHRTQYYFQSLKPLDFQSLTYCESDSAERTVMEGLIFLRQYGRLPSLGLPLDQNILGPNAWEFVKNRISRIHFRSEGEGMCGYQQPPNSKVASPIASLDSNNNTINICESFKGLSPLMTASYLVHEAQHTSGFFHVDCRQFQLAGAKIACEESYQGKGSYTAQIEFYLRLSRHRSLDGATRVSLKSLTIEMLLARFNVVPFQIQKGILLKEKDGSIFLFGMTELKKISNEEVRKSLIPVEYGRKLQSPWSHEGTYAISDHGEIFYNGPNGSEVVKFPGTGDFRFDSMAPVIFGSQELNRL
jgi:hypothetical protein